METETVETLAAELIEDLGLPGRGLQLRRLAGGWRLETKGTCRCDRGFKAQSHDEAIDRAGTGDAGNCRAQAAGEY